MSYPIIHNNGIALLSVDNTKTFEDKNLDELYVQNGEHVAQQTKKIIDICQNYEVLLINVFDSHPNGHISFASSYTDRKNFETISYADVADRTDQENGLSSQAQFNVEQLKHYLLSSPSQTNRLRPDHGKDRTESKDLMPPLQENDFHISMPKGYQIDKHPYGGFIDTDLMEILTKNKIHTVLVTGVATDYCVKDTVLEALTEKYTTYLLTDAIAAIYPEQEKTVIHQLHDQGAIIITSQNLEQILTQI